MRKETIAMFILTVVLLVTMSTSMARGSEVDTRLCVPMDALAEGLQLHSEEGKTTGIKNIGDGKLELQVGNMFTKWFPHPDGHMLWCMQPDASAKGA